MYFVIIMSLITVWHLIPDSKSFFLNMKISNSLETYYQDNYVPIICVFLRNAVSLLSRKLIRIRFFFFFSPPNYTEDLYWCLELILVKNDNYFIPKHWHFWVPKVQQLSMSVWHNNALSYCGCGNGIIFHESKKVLITGLKHFIDSKFNLKE